MADLQVLSSEGVSSVTVDASATTFLTGYFLSNDGSGNWVLADADVAARQDAQWICLESVSAGGSATYTMPVAKRIVAKDTDASAYTAGALLFLSATAGQHTATQPTAAIGTMQRVVGKAVTANVIVLSVVVPHYYVMHSLEDTQGATAANYGAFFIAPRPLRLIEARESHSTAGTNGSAVTLDIEKMGSGVALDSGTAMLLSTINLKGTADTPVARLASATAATARVATGDRVALLDAGTLTAVAGVVVTLAFVDEQAI